MFGNEDDNYNGDYIRPTEEYRSDCTEEHEHGQTYENYNQEQEAYETHSEVESEFASTLMPGENILWCGAEGKKGCISSASCLSAIFPTFWLGFAIFWTLGAFTSGGPVFALFGVPFILVGIFLFKKIVFEVGGKRSFAVTDRRVIVNTGGKFTSDRLENICNINYKETSPGIGYVSFVMIGAAVYGANSRTPGRPYVFSGLKNPAEVCRILSDAVYSVTRLK